MRLHLIIQRHGLPVTRILWTTDSSAAVASSAVASARTPNTTYGNNGYTIAQLLEDVNEVIPLETDGDVGGEDDNLGGQWGLEDYVVEVAGFECLHFMNVEGLLKEEDHVVIRALQTADLRARRLSGRVQISAEGRHLLDGVPFGRPYLKRSFSSRPAIRIPSRKRRRISFSSWDEGFRQVDDEEDAEWSAETNLATGRELVRLEDSADSSDQDTVVRNRSQTQEGQESSSEDEISEPELEDLTEELRALREDLDSAELPATSALKGPRLTRTSGRISRLGKRSTKDLESLPQSPASRRSSDIDGPSQASPRSSKNVRFNAALLDGDHSPSITPAGSRSGEGTSNSEAESSENDPISSESNVDSDIDTDLDSEADSEAASDSDSDSDFSDDSSSVNSSISEDTQIAHRSPKGRPQTKISAPGQGSKQTKNSNRRTKLRRRLAKLKELGLLPPEANFDDLRAWEEVHGRGGPLHEVKDLDEARLSQTRERSEFEARRERLLRDIEAGGVDVDAHSEKENIPPKDQSDKLSENENPQSGVENAATTATMTTKTTENGGNGDTAESPKRRKLDVASTKRLLFGSLGVRTPKNKQEEENTRNKLAAKAKPPFVPSSHTDAEIDLVAESQEAEPEDNWQDKIDVRATECVFEDIEMSAPPFPFVQKWDADANALIRQRKSNGSNKSRKKNKRLSQVEDQHQHQDEDVNVLEYDEPPAEVMEIPENELSPETDLPDVPRDISQLQAVEYRDLTRGDIIAFKQLQMGKETAWCPVISDYRVAEVHQVIGESSLKVRLAKRHRSKKGEDDDEEPSGFDTPWLEEEQSADDGLRELGFDELIEPKFIRKSGASSQKNGEDHDQSTSLVTDNSVLTANISKAPVQAEGLPHNGTLSEISPQPPNEVAETFHDAAFDSNVHHNLVKFKEPLEVTESIYSPQNISTHGQMSPPISSPAFHGWVSSPDSTSIQRTATGSLSNEASVLTHGMEDIQEHDGTSKSPTSYQVPPTQSQVEITQVQYPELALSLDTATQSQFFTVNDSPVDRFMDSMLVDDFESSNFKKNGNEERSHPITGNGAVRSSSPASSDASDPLKEHGKAGEESPPHPESGALNSRISISDDLLIDADSRLNSPEPKFPSTAPIQAAREAEGSTPRTRRKAMTSPIQHSSPAGSVKDSVSNPSGAKRRSQRLTSGRGRHTEVVIDLSVSGRTTSSQTGHDVSSNDELPHGPGRLRKSERSQSRTRTRSSTRAETEAGKNDTSPLHRPRTRSQRLD